VTNRNSSDFFSASPASPVNILLLYTQSKAHMLSDLCSCERFVHNAERYIDHCINDTFRHAFLKRPIDLFLCASCGAPGKDRQMFGRNKEQRVTHARSFDQLPFIDGIFYIFDL
jgi:hypothetical protein